MLRVKAFMRTLLYLSAFFVSGAIAFPQAALVVNPAPSAVCSIPLLRVVVPPNLDPLIATKLPPVSDKAPAVKLPAPPCGEAAAQASVPARRQAGPMGRIRTLQNPFSTLIRRQSAQPPYGIGGSFPSSRE